MKQFIDQNGCRVQLTFKEKQAKREVGHVLVLCRYKEQWLLTKHQERGLEFPGGKVENGEDPEEAAKREVFEETGALIGDLNYIGQYEVICRDSAILKNIYFTEVGSIQDCDHYYETEGPVLIRQLPQMMQEDSRFSFIMKDELLPSVLNELKKRNHI